MFFAIFILLFNPLAFSSSPSFSFHLHGEPYSLDPIQVAGSSGSYLFSNIFRGLYRYHPEKGLIPDEAEKCEWKSKLQLVCTLKTGLKYSDGSSVLAPHYVYNFRRLMDPNSKTVQTDLLLALKNAKSVLNKEKPVINLGVNAPDDRTLIFDFETHDPEFLYRLTSNALVPMAIGRPPDRENVKQAVYNGPYKVTEWIKGRRIKLEPNPYYPGHEKRPPVEIFMIDDDDTALRLYETGKLQLNRRVTTLDIPALEKRKDFFQIPLARFDYIGFGPELKNQKDLRKAFAYSLNYAEQQELYKALGRPGCPALPKSWLEKIPCLEFDLKKAKQHWDKVPKELREKKWILGFSRQGGESIQKGMEWMQHQWKKHLGANIELQSMENGVYINLLKNRPPDLFRKGVGLERPTCLAGLEVLEPNNKENYMHLDDKQYNAILSQLKMAKTDQKKKQLCSQAAARLIAEPFLIPQGEIYFSMLARPQFKGWWINEINQLDLSELTYNP